MASSNLFDKLLLAFNENEIAQEALEGTMGGGLSGIALLGTDTPLPSIGLQTGAAILGGAGIGILGSHLGAALGKAIYRKPLKNQEGIVATLGRTLGSKTLKQGASETLRQGKGMIKKELVEQSSRQMIEEAMRNPKLFASKYGISAEEFQAMMPYVNQGRTVQSLLETYANLSKDQQAQLKSKLMDSYGRVEQAAANNAANNIDNTLKTGAANARKMSETNPNFIPVADMFESLQNPMSEVTGEHIGRAIGRFIGDEIGIIAGMNLGRMAADQMGIKTEKDKEIEALQNELAALQSSANRNKFNSLPSASLYYG